MTSKSFLPKKPVIMQLSADPSIFSLSALGYWRKPKAHYGDTQWYLWMSFFSLSKLKDHASGVKKE
jgi:hypothetical protein